MLELQGEPEKGNSYIELEIDLVKFYHSTLKILFYVTVNYNKFALRFYTEKHIENSNLSSHEHLIKMIFLLINSREWRIKAD